MEKSLNIRYIGMAGTNHSWSQTAQALCRAFKNLGHNVIINTTNGDLRMPHDLQKMVTTKPGLPQHDIDFTYTLPSNFKKRLHGRTNLGIYNYESSSLPQVQRNGINYCDYLLPSSDYCKDIFINAGINKEKLVTVPHGVDTHLFNSSIPVFDKFQIDKTFRFLCVAIPHARKNFEGLIEAYAKAFTKQDDVCLVLKTRDLRSAIKMGQKIHKYDVNVVDIIKKIRQQYDKKNFPAIELIDGSIDDMASLYNACDAFVSMTHCEGFGLPFLETMACEKPVIAPDFSGQKDFLNTDNSLLIKTGTMYAPETMQYWDPSPKAITGKPDIKHCAQLMRELYDNYNATLNRLKPGMAKTVSEFTWERAAQIMVDLHYDNIIKQS